MNTKTQDTDALIKRLLGSAKFGGYYKAAADKLKELQAEVDRLRPCAEAIVEAAQHGDWAPSSINLKMALEALHPLIDAQADQDNP